MTDVADIPFHLRKGVEWEIQPYLRLIETLCTLRWEDRDLEKLTIDEISQLTVACYEKWGDQRRDYFTALITFFKKHHTQVHEDCILFRNDCEIIPPKLKAFRIFVQQVVEVLTEPQYQAILFEYVNHPSYKIPAPVRKEMAQNMLIKANKNEGEDVDKAFRKLNRLLLDHRIPMCQIFSEIINAIATPNNDGLEQHGKRTVPALGNVTEVRRTSRLTELEKQRNKMREMQLKIENATESDFKRVRISETIGDGVVALRKFAAKEFLMEYAGDLLSRKEGKKMHEKYSHDHNIGSYIFDFTFGTQSYSIDATEDRGRLARLINHSKKNPNVKLKVMHICGRPRLLMFAMRDIEPHEQLLYDYGDRNVNTRLDHPWLAE